MGAFTSPEACCYPTDGASPGAGGGSYVAQGSEDCKNCMDLICESLV